MLVKCKQEMYAVLVALIKTYIAHPNKRTSPVLEDHERDGGSIMLRVFALHSKAQLECGLRHALALHEEMYALSFKDRDNTNHDIGAI